MIFCVAGGAVGGGGRAYEITRDSFTECNKEQGLLRMGEEIN
jgi:hypothetical protein